MFDTIVFVLFLIFFASLSISVVRTKIKNYKLLEQLLAANIEKALLAEKLEKELLKNSSISNVDQEGFVNFLSTSRDWAFAYIEDVQAKLKSFQNIVGGIFTNFKNNKITDLNLALTTILASYEDLIAVLPEENELVTDSKEKK